MITNSKPRTEMSHDEICDETIEKMGGDKKFIEFYHSLTHVSHEMKNLYDHLSWNNRTDAQWLEQEAAYHAK